LKVTPWEWFGTVSFASGTGCSDIILAVNTEKTIRINQLPVSATRWQHGSQICFATFIQWKSTKFIEVREKI